jgi:hypothetical protein
MFNNALLMGAAAQGGDSLVTIDNSALFSEVNQSLSRTQGSGSNTVWTFSSWVYKCETKNQVFLNAGTSTEGQLGWNASDQMYIYNGATTVGLTTQLFRDIGWYHIHVAYNTGLSSDSKVRLSVNGKLVTAWATDNRSSAGAFNNLNQSSVALRLGNNTDDSGTICLSGYMAETVILDGTASAVTNFGEFDSSGLYWTPKSSASIKALTFGTNGFYLDNTTNAQTDASGEGNNFTNNNSVATNLHTPTNLYAIQNPLTITNSYPSTLSDGNLKQTGNSGGSFASGTLATVPCDGGGKFYWEAKCLGLYTTSAYITLGVAPMDLPRINNTDGNGNFCLPGQQDYQGVSITFNGASYTNLRGNSLGVNSNIVSALTIATNDFMQIAFDSATQKVWFGKNNSWYNSGDPAAGSNETITLTATDKTWFPWFGTYTASDIWLINYGATDFEYTPPTGFNKVTTSQIASDTTRTASDTNKYFQTVLYEGNGSGQRVGAFQPFTDSFTIAKSALFTSGNEEYFTRTFATPTDQDVWTLSWWMKTGNLGATPRGIMGGAASNSSLIYVTTANIYIYFNGGAGFTFDVDDPSQWQNIILTCSGTTLTCYWNGVSQGTASVTMGDFNSAVAHTIGSYNGDANWFDGYMADFIFVDGTVHSTSVFGQTDTSTNRWVPKDPTTTLDEASDFGNNGFFLNFADSSDMGNDISGNNHDWTNNNTVTQSTDSPTSNYAILDPSYAVNIGFALSNGNRTNKGTTASLYGNTRTGLTFGNTKTFAMLLIVAGGSGGSVGTGFSVAPDSYVPDGNNGGNTGTYANIQAYGSSTRVIIGDAKGITGQVLTHSVAVDDGDYYTMAVDPSNGNIWFGVYDTSGGSHQYLPNVVGGTAGNPSDGTLPTVTGVPFNNERSCLQTTGYNTSSSSTLVLNSGDMPMSLPTDYVEFKQDNTTDTGQFISAFSWIKNRDAADNNMLFDRVRGVTKDLHSNTTDIEVTNTDTVQQFLSAGVQVGNDVQVNTVNESYALWNWMMEATGSGSSLTGGDINTTALVDTTLGMAVGTYSGSNSNQTIETGVTNPKMVIIKRLNATYAWAVWHEGLTDDYNILLNTAAGQVDSDYFDTSENTSTLFHLLGNSNATSIAGGEFVYYAFADSQFISVGSYRGNEDVNGTFVPTLNSLGIPIQPVWVMVKNSVQARSWNIIDTARNPYNVSNYVLEADTTTAQQTGSDTLWNMDIDTGGFKLRSSHETSNGAETMIYLAIGTPIIDTDGRIIAGR